MARVDGLQQSPIAWSMRGGATHALRPSVWLSFAFACPDPPLHREKWRNTEVDRHFLERLLVGAGMYLGEVVAKRGSADASVPAWEGRKLVRVAGGYYRMGDSVGAARHKPRRRRAAWPMAAARIGRCFRLKLLPWAIRIDAFVLIYCFLVVKAEGLRPQAVCFVTRCGRSFQRRARPMHEASPCRAKMRHGTRPCPHNRENFRRRDALIRRRLKATGLEAQHVILAVRRAV